MLCQCGNRIPDNASYCPYCGKKNNSMRTRPDSLIHDDSSYEPEYDSPQVASGVPSKAGGCLGKLIRFVLGLALLLVFFVGIGIAVAGDPMGFFHELQDMSHYVTDAFQ